MYVHVSYNKYTYVNINTIFINNYVLLESCFIIVQYVDIKLK